MSSNLIDRIKLSKNPLLISEMESLEKWENVLKLKNKHNLELFLQFNIAELRFKPKNSAKYANIVCTSNTQFIEIFKPLKESRKLDAQRSTPFSGIYTKNPFSIMTYNLLSNRYNTIMLKAWDVLNFITISPQNILVLDKIVNDILGRKIQKG